MKMNKRRRLMVAVGAVGLIAAAGFGAVAVPERGSQASSADPDVTGLLRERSPGMRLAGAETVKYGPIPASAITPISAPRPQVLSERDTGAPRMAMVPPEMIPSPPAPVSAPAIGTAQAAVPPTAIAPALGPSVGVPVAAAAASGAGLAALLPVIPAAIAIGGGGSGGNSPSSIAPAVPEPKTWMMMITGFGLLGMALRRRRRQEWVNRRTATQPS